MVRARTDSRVMPTSFSAAGRPVGATRHYPIVEAPRRRGRHVRVRLTCRRRSKRSRCSITSWATSMRLRSWLNGVGSQSDQCLVDADASWTAIMPAAWWTTKRKFVPDLELGPNGARRGASLHPDDRPSSDAGHDEGIGVLVGGQRPGRSRYKLSAPRRASPIASGNPNTARAPAATACSLNAAQRVTRGVGEVRLDDGAVVAVGVDARTLAQRVLQLLDRGADVVRRAHRTLRAVVEHQHDAGAGHLGDLRADDAQASRRRLAVGITGETSQDAQQPIVRHLGPRGRPGPSRSIESVWSWWAAKLLEGGAKRGPDQHANPWVITIMPENLGAATHHVVGESAAGGRLTPRRWYRRDRPRLGRDAWFGPDGRVVCRPVQARRRS